MSGELLDSVALIALAVAPPMLSTVRSTSQVSLGSMALSLSPDCWEKTPLPLMSSSGCAVAPTAASAGPGMTIPAPVERSTPAASISMAVEVSAVRTWAGVSEGLPAFSKAAIAAACGAEAEVP